ncbi:protein translocase subunit SecD [Clostridium sp. UBA5119]|uniref:protein translocase subunit SecD n=1 Tax=Clostridium sp. UBA5119 TaxID=1946366 RepID=UPI003216EB57
MRRKNRKSGIVVIIAIILIGLFAYAGLYGVNLGNYRIKTFGSSIDKGLDLVGGTSLLMEIKEEKVDQAVIDRTIELISMRINKDGVSEIPITQEGENRIRIEIPGEFDTDKVLDTIGKTGELTFEDPDGKVILTGKEVKEAGAYISQDNKYIVNLELNEDGTAKFAEATKTFLNKSIAIKMDGEILTNPTVNAVISDGKAIIEGMSSLEEANSIASIITSGALPVKIEAISVKTVGPTIGAEALSLSKKAAMIGIACIILFMVAYYRVPGLIASVAIVLYVSLVLIVFSQFGVVLTLAGIAGLILTIGMAVDANVLIFERTKEELRLGKSIKTSVEAGYNRALSSILDSNITTIIAALVLYFLGSGSVKGFAVTLLVGILISIFTALFVTKFLLNSAVNAGWINKPSYFGVREGKKHEFSSLKIIEKTKIWFAISIIIIAIGVGFIATKGLNYGIDFKGGTLITLDMNKEFNKADVNAIIDKYAKDKYSTKLANEGKEIQIIVQEGVLNEEKTNALIDEIKEKYSLEDSALIGKESIGATVGNELKKKALLALGVASIAMLIYITARFEFSYAAASIIALLHDVLITLSFYAIFGIQANSPFIAAILTIVGYSINDTIVIFDRIRENVKRNRRMDQLEVANMSIKETMTRSINTSLTTLITIVAVYILVPSIREFSLPLIVGIACGAYSSIFIASPLWVIIKNAKQKKKAKVVA